MRAMKLIHVAAAVLDQTPLDWSGNVSNLHRVLELARERRVDVLCLPELCIPGYGCDDAYQSPGVQQTSLEILDELLPAMRGMVVAIGLPMQFRKALFAVVALVADGEILGFAAKRHLAGDGLYYEPRWFRPWPRGAVARVDLPGGRRLPLGDVYFVCDGVGIGFEICEEAWVASRPGSSLAARGVDLVLNPSASHFAFGKHEIRRRFVLEGSRAFGVGYVFANHLGNAAGRMLFDGGAMIASHGRMVAEGSRFSFERVGLTSAVLDIDEIRMRQVRVGSFVPDVDVRADERVVAPGFGFAAPRPSAPTVDPPPRVFPSPRDKEEEFARAIALGLFDYLRKSRSRGFVVSLSGGADSAATAALAALALRMAAAELGPEGLRARLSHLEFEAVTDGDRAGDGLPDVDAIVRRMLLCVYQATRNSSDTTRDAARKVAEGVGAEFMVLDVDPLVQSYVSIVEQGIDRPLTWEHDDLALQNIQARVRAPSVWLLANVRGALLLSTSNRSEAAVGYATMDGDTAGGLSPIAGIDKAFLRRWLRWLETTGPRGVGPVPELAAVNALAPTAELRPHEADQTDEDDLMPYDVLDAIERAAIGEKKMPLEVYRVMHERFPAIDPPQLVVWIERFFRLWCRNQWKRERYAPSFHVDDENLDPKTWCRFPILSGGFERELADLRSSVLD
ncbi:MAG: NAD(+) synthase [Acidobacteriota bacterium]